MLTAGLTALVTWEAFARFIAPIWLGRPLAPAAIIQAALDLPDSTIAQLLHLIIGLIVFPIGYVFVVRPVVTMVIPRVRWWALGASYAVGLWALGLYVMTHLVSGFVPFLDAGTVVWLSLIGHLAYGLALSGMLKWHCI
jgi:hypothetical protein